LSWSFRPEKATFWTGVIAILVNKIKTEKTSAAPSGAALTTYKTDAGFWQRHLAPQSALRAQRGVATPNSTYPKKTLEILSQKATFWYKADRFLASKSHFFGQAFSGVSRGLHQIRILKKARQERESLRQQLVTRRPVLWAEKSEQNNIDRI
jgi:hypothetical protein